MTAWEAYAPTPMDYGEKWNRTVVRALLDCPPGLATGDQISYEVMHATECIRGRTRAVLRALVADGYLEVGWIRHKDAQFDTYDIDDAARERLRALLAAFPSVETLVYR